jgi:uncharacterized membrane protein
MSTVGLVHLVFALCAMLLGLLVVLQRKGTRIHRTIGHLYVSSMLGLNVTALSIYQLFKTFGPFHVLALVSLATLLAGVVPVVTRRPKRAWLDLHANFMAWSYAGLLAAAASELVVRVPLGGRYFAYSVTSVSFAVILVAAWIIHGRQRRVILGAMTKAGIRRDWKNPGVPLDSMVPARVAEWQTQRTQNPPGASP